MKPEDIFLESDEEKAKLSTAAVERYLLDIIDCVIKIPYTLKQMKEMSKEQFNNRYLKIGAFQSTSASKYNINIPKEEEMLSVSAHSVKSNVYILPLSLKR